jgi:hypothetical protein
MMVTFVCPVRWFLTKLRLMHIQCILIRGFLWCAFASIQIQSRLVYCLFLFLAKFLLCNEWLVYETSKELISSQLMEHNFLLTTLHTLNKQKPKGKPGICTPYSSRDARAVNT